MCYRKTKYLIDVLRVWPQPPPVSEKGCADGRADIEDIEKERKRNPDTAAIYILSPLPHIVDCLVEDLKNRQYGRTFLFWTSSMSGTALIFAQVPSLMSLDSTATATPRAYPQHAREPRTNCAIQSPERRFLPTGVPPRDFTRSLQLSRFIPSCL
jgi:hypothetical protein